MGRFFGRGRREGKVDSESVVERPLVTGVGLSSAAQFRMIVQDVFDVKGRGVVVCGTIEAGTIVVGSSVAVDRDGRQLGTSEVLGIERGRKLITEAEAGEDVGLLLSESWRGAVVKGDVLRAPGS